MKKRKKAPLKTTEAKQERMVKFLDLQSAGYKDSQMATLLNVNVKTIERYRREFRENAAKKEFDTNEVIATFEERFDSERRELFALRAKAKQNNQLQVAVSAINADTKINQVQLNLYETVGKLKFYSAVVDEISLAKARRLSTEELLREDMKLTRMLAERAGASIVMGKTNVDTDDQD